MGCRRLVAANSTAVKRPDLENQALPHVAVDIVADRIPRTVAEELLKLGTGFVVALAAVYIHAGALGLAEVITADWRCGGCCKPEGEENNIQTELEEDEPG
ncbi:MAG: hypothetical protein Q9217_005898 [Psora testacea]